MNAWPAPAEGAASNLAGHWPVSPSHPFRQAIKVGPGFSFRYDGPAGLALSRPIRPLPEREAVEYSVRFRNESDRTLPAPSLQALDLAFGREVVEGLTLVSASRAASGDTFPPKGFAVSRHWFGPLLPVNARLVLTSSDDLPFWFFDNPNLQAGLYFAMVAADPWEAAVAVDFQRGILSLTAGSRHDAPRVEPGEEIVGPAILLGAYRGPVWNGSNRLRRLTRGRFEFPLTARDPHILRFQTHGLHYFLPADAFPAAPPGPWEGQIPDLAAQSFFGAWFRPANWPVPAERHAAIYREIRKFLVEDYYPLTPQARDLDAWEAWQFHDPNSDEGFIQAFRLRSADGFRQFRLQALTPPALYRFRDPYTGDEIRLTGAQALEEGVGFGLPEMSSKILTYRRQDRLRPR